MVGLQELKYLVCYIFPVVQCPNLGGLPTNLPESDPGRSIIAVGIVNELATHSPIGVMLRFGAQGTLSLLTNFPDPDSDCDVKYHEAYR